MSKEKARKVKAAKVYTRAQAEKALSNGAEPEQFVKHPNYHVRRKAWVLMGRILPDNHEEAAKFLESLHIKPKLEMGTEPVLLPTDELGMVDLVES
jgi:hypothetical protein